jgi:hypothetical protein
MYAFPLFYNMTTLAELEDVNGICRANISQKTKSSFLIVLNYMM